MKKLLIIGSLVIICMMVLSLWLFRPIKIGVILSNETSLGYEENLLVKFYGNKFPRVGLKPVTFIIENPPALEEKLFREAFYRLEDQGVSLIISGELSQTAMFVAPLAEETGIPTMGVTSSTHDLSGKKDNFYRIITPTNFLGTYMADFVHELGHERVAMVTSVENASYAGALADSFARGFSGETLRIPFDDYVNVMETLTAFEPDALYCVLPETTLMQVIKGVREKSDLEIFSSEWGFMQLTSVFSGPLLNGITAITRSGEVPDPYREIILEFEKIYSIESTFASHNAFALLDIVYDGIREAGPGADRLRRYLNEPRFYDSIIGSFYMDEYGDSQQQYLTFYHIINDELELRKKMENEEYYHHLEE